jgi:hypothetical protein
VAGLALAGCSDSTKPSIPLAEIPLRAAGGSSSIFCSLNVYVGYATGLSINGPMIIDTVTITGPTAAAEVRTGGDAGFADAVAMLTDGADQVIQRGFFNPVGGGSSLTGPESGFIGGGVSGTLSPDFAGYTITRIVLTVDTMTFATPGSDPNGNGNWTDYLFSGHVIVEGYQN